MFFKNENKKTRTEFWREYEKNIDEKIFAYSLGRYINGFEELKTPLWGLLIVSESGFRFHYFPHETWLQAISRMSYGGEAQKEIVIIIPKEKILSSDLFIEKSFLKKLFLSCPPLFTIHYTNDSGVEYVVNIETVKDSIVLVEYIRRWCTRQT